MAAPSTMLYGAISLETRNIKDAHKRLCERGVYEEKSVGVNVKYRPVKRTALTPQGFEKFIKEIDDEDPLKNTEINNRKISNRNGLSADNFMRMCRQADAQYFFHSVGVESPYTLIKNYNANPFLFGYPECNSGSDSIIIMDIVKETLVNYAKKREEMEDPLAEPDKNCPTALFLPNVYNPKSKTVPDADTRVRMVNNAVGLLFDFQNQRAYVVFKQFGRKTQKWMGKAYQTWLARCGPVMKKLGIKNADSLTGVLEDAIYLCETQGEIQEIAKQCDKMRSPFKRVVPILTNQNGAEMLGTILVSGLDEYEKMLTLEISRIVKETEWVKRQPIDGYAAKPILKLRLHGKQVVNGLLLNYRWMGDMLQHLGQKKPQIPYLVCYEWQRKMYEDIIGFPVDSLVVITEED